VGPGVSGSTAPPGTKRMVTAAYDATAEGFAGAADRLVYRHLAGPLVDAVGVVDGPVLDVAAGSGAAGRRFTDAVALDLSMGQLRHNPAPRRVLADAERLPFRHNSFGAAVSVFGINHFPDPGSAVAEMARVAPVVAVATWARPERPFAPKQVVGDVLARHAGRTRSPVGEVVDALSEQVGSIEAVTALLSGAGLEPAVEQATVVVPWPGIEAFLDYRLSMASTAGLVADAETLRREATAALEALPDGELEWHAVLIVGVGRR
jgi:SAM-dependent methyltransferase